MKKVEFTITLETHEGLDEKKLKHILERYLINNVSMLALVQKVIGEIDCPENFNIKSVSLGSNKKKVVKKEKPKSKAKTKKWN